MLRSYFKIALRNLTSYKAYTAINIIGLAVGVACVIMITLFVMNELSYDRYNEHAGRIYRACFSATFNGREIRTALSPAPWEKPYRAICQTW